MPVYCFKCPICGKRSELLRSMSAMRDPAFCECGAEMRRDMRAEHTNTPLQDFRTPIEMFSIAPETPDQERELRRKCPEVEWDEQLKVPRARNRHQKLALLKAVGFVERS